MNIRFLVSVFLVFLLFVLPAYAYGDPSGGMLFRMLGPMLAMLWGLWVILANSVRRRIADLVSKFRNARPDDPTS